MPTTTSSATSSNTPSPSKERAGVRPLNPHALSFDAKGTPPPEPVGGDEHEGEAPQQQQAGNKENRQPSKGQGSDASAAGSGFVWDPSCMAPMPMTVTAGDDAAPPTTTSSQPLYHPSFMARGGGSGTGAGGSHTPPQGISPPKGSGRIGPLGGGVGVGVGVGGSISALGVGPSGLTEAEFLHTRNLLEHVPQPALAAVMQSLMDDFPQLAPVIRVRSEKAMSFMMRQQQQHHHRQGFSPGGSPQQYQRGVGRISPSPDPSSQQHSSHPHHQRPSHEFVTPPGSTKKSSAPTTGGSGGSGGSRRKDEEHETCGVHGSIRPVKHLSFNEASQQWECIPGFHCLVDNLGGGGIIARSGSVTPASTGGGTPLPGRSPMKGEQAARHQDLPRRASGTPLLHTVDGASHNQHDTTATTKSEGADLVGSKKGTIGTGVSGGGGGGSNGSMDVNKLETLLQSLRYDEEEQQPLPQPHQQEQEQ